MATDFSCVVLDLDGTLYHRREPLPGAAEAVSRLRAAGVATRFATNTFSSPPAQIAERLRGFGIELDEAELYTPHRALEAYLGRSLRERPELRVHAFVNESTRTHMPYLPPRTDGPPELVILGDGDDDWSYAALDRILSYLADGAELVASSPARTFIGRDGRPHLDTGALVALFESAAGGPARIMGKPSAELSRLIAADAGADAGRMLFVGDDPAIDMAAAAAVGARSALVLTGKGATAARSPAPDYVLGSIAELPALLGLP